MNVQLPRIRPTLACRSDHDHACFAERIRAALKRSKRINGLIIGSRVELVPSPDLQHFWSPQLTATIEPMENGSVLKGRFGPHPSTWTFYVAIHALGAFTTLAAALFGLSQALTGQSPWALWVLPASPILAVLVWSLAFVGQSMGADQMLELRRLVEDAGSSSDSGSGHRLALLD